MELFGIGIWELILIILIALIILGPQDTVRVGRNIGRAVRRFFSSEEWRTMLQATKDIRQIPEKLLEETGLDHPEEILPSEAEIRQEAGLDELEQNMSQWKADLNSMRKGDTATSAAVTSSVPTQQIIPTSIPTKEEIALGFGSHESRLQGAGINNLKQAPSEKDHLADNAPAELASDLAEWKADLSAWGTSSVIIPIPSAPSNPPANSPIQAEPSKPPASGGKPQEDYIAADNAPAKQAAPAENEGQKE